jgi:hypothetical protein
MAHGRENVYTGRIISPDQPTVPCPTEIVAATTANGIELKNLCRERRHVGFVAVYYSSRDSMRISVHAEHPRIFSRRLHTWCPSFKVLAYIQLEA